MSNYRLVLMNNGEFVIQRHALSRYDMSWHEVERGRNKNKLIKNFEKLRAAELYAIDANKIKEIIEEIVIE